MNFIFLSPNYPDNYWNFCDRLKKNGVNVLGVGDAPYENLPQDLRDSLTEYYRIDSLSDYDQLYRAVAFFSFKYGKIDRIESMNPYWLSQEVLLRTDFNIAAGPRHYPATAIDAETLAKNQNAEGTICSYDAVSDSNGDPLFESMTVWPEAALTKTVDTGIVYYTCPGMPAKLRSLGRKTLKSLDAKSRFVHFVFKCLTKDQEGFGSEGDYIAIDTDLCPAGGYIPDMMNFAHSVDVYKIWADMITTDRRYLDGKLQTASELSHHTAKTGEEDCFSVHASRKEGPDYVHPESRIADKFHDVIVMRKELPEAAWQHIGRYVYTLRLRSQHEVDTFIKFLHETN